MTNRQRKAWNMAKLVNPGGRVFLGVSGEASCMGCGNPMKNVEPEHEGYFDGFVCETSECDFKGDTLGSYDYYDHLYKYLKRVKR